MTTVLECVQQPPWGSVSSNSKPCCAWTVQADSQGFLEYIRHREKTEAMDSSYKITVKTKYQHLFSRYITLMRQQWDGVLV